MNIDDISSKITDALKKEMRDMGHVNIIVSGKTGVGKSTLINSVFREKLATTGRGAPVTKQVREYTKKDFPLRVYDTVGLELGTDNQQQVADDINTIIKEALASGDKDKYIHCIWYCVNPNTNRFEPMEEVFVDKLAQENKHTGVPVVIVLTLAHNKKISQEMRDYINERNLNIEGIVIVLAEDYSDEDFLRKAYGGDELVEFTYNILPEAVQTAFVNAQSASLKLKIDKANAIIASVAATNFGIGFAPIPFADAPAIVMAQVGMISSITAVYGSTVDKSVTTAIITSLLGTSGATLLGRTIVSNAVKFIPGVGFAMGGVISGTTAAVLTTALGRTYIVILEKLAKGEISESDIKTKKFTETMKKLFKNEMAKSKNLKPKNLKLHKARNEKSNNEKPNNENLNQEKSNKKIKLKKNPKNKKSKNDDENADKNI